MRLTWKPKPTIERFTCDEVLWDGVVGKFGPHTDRRELSCLRLTYSDELRAYLACRVRAARRAHGQA